jgi:hypothetical protein
MRFADISIARFLEKLPIGHCFNLPKRFRIHVIECFHVSFLKSFQFPVEISLYDWELETRSYALPNAFRTLSGVAGDSTHLPIALWIAIMMRCVFAREWLMPLPP